MTPEEVLGHLPLAPGRQNPEFQEVFDRWQEFNRSIIEMARDAGNFSTSSCLSGVIPCTSTPIASSACAACSGVTLVTPHHFHGVFWNVLYARVGRSNSLEMAPSPRKGIPGPAAQAARNSRAV